MKYLNVIFEVFYSFLFALVYIADLKMEFKTSLWEVSTMLCIAVTSIPALSNKTVKFIRWIRQNRELDVL